MKDDKNKSVNKLNEEFDSDLQTWYELQEQELPSSELDDAIIKMAKDARLNHGKSPAEGLPLQPQEISHQRTDNLIRVEDSFWRKNRWALSSAASVMLVVTVVMLNPQSPQEILSDDAMPMMMQMSAPADEQAESFKEQTAVAGKSAELKREQVDMAPRTMSATPHKPEAGYQAETVIAPQVQQLGSSYHESDSETLAVDAANKVQSATKLPDNGLANKSMPQREAVVSAKQALNHLEHLIETEQFAEAEKLINKITKQYPNLKQVTHPQHQRWSELQAEIVVD